MKHAAPFVLALLLVPAGNHGHHNHGSPALADGVELPQPVTSPGLLDWLWNVASPTLPLPPPKHVG